MRLLRLAPLAALLLLPVAAPAPTPSNGVFVHDEGGATPVSVRWEGPCNGEGVLHVTFPVPSGPVTVSSAYRSAMTPDACWTFSCYECPPVPIPVAWTLEPAGGGPVLAGGGSAYYDAYRHWELAYSMQGGYGDGMLEWRGVLGHVLG